MATKVKKAHTRCPGRVPNTPRERGLDPDELEKSRREIAGALWSLQSGIEWARRNASSIGEDALADDLDQALEWLYYMADALNQEGEPVKSWDGRPIPSRGEPIALIQRWLGIEGLARIGEGVEDEEA